MSITTNQTISKYYELFGKIDVTFTKEVSAVFGHLPQGCYLKCIGEQWPCVVYSASMMGAKIIAAITPQMFEKIKAANNSVSIRFAFKTTDKADPVTFFIVTKILGFAPYNNANRQDLKFITLQYTQRPPDFLIELIGKFIEANVNSAKRRDERVLLTVETLRKLSILKDATISVQGVPRKAILRDISFSGAKVIIVGIAKFLVGKDCSLKIDAEEPRESFVIQGKVLRFEEVEGRKDLAALALQFTETLVPMGYKMRLNEFLTAFKKNVPEAQAAPEETPAPQKKQVSASPASPKQPEQPQPNAQEK